MIYVDNSATSWPKAPGVAEALAQSITEPIGNVGRSSHAPALAASEIVYKFRESVQHFIPPTGLEKTIITRNATEALNLAIFGSLSDSEHGSFEHQQTVLTTPVEHNAVARPLHVLANRGVKLVYAECDKYGRVIIESFRDLLASASVNLVVCTAANNLTGAVNPVGDMVRACVDFHVPFIIDGAQAIGEMSFDAFVEGAEGALCFSLHKGLLGPTGVGVMALYGGFSPRPLVYGGTGSRSDSVVQPDFLPDVYESGTPAIHAIAGSIAALSYGVQNRESIVCNRNNTAQRLWEGLSDIVGLRMLSPQSNRLPVVSVTVNEGTISRLARGLFMRDIAIRSGFHCAPLAHQFLGTKDHGGAVRFSVGYTTTMEEVSIVVSAVKEIIHE
jgi:selenocysteine lyase/cysteine desulfurase